MWNGLPVLASGEPYYTSFYVILAVEGLMALYLAGVTIWLSVPKRNRELGQGTILGGQPEIAAFCETLG